MILISKQALKDILYETNISPEEKGKLVAKIESCNLYKEDKEESLLDALNSLEFNIKSDPADIHKYRFMYLGIKGYLEGKITLETAYDKYFGDYCPPFGYTWCERGKDKINDCNNCDLNEKQWPDDSARCLECWKRALKAEKERLK
jgi:hypothetical protein